jgi:hypothetical protein
MVSTQVSTQDRENWGPLIPIYLTGYVRHRVSRTVQFWTLSPILDPVRSRTP